MENTPKENNTKEETQAFLSDEAAKNLNETSKWMLYFTIIFSLLLLVFFAVTIVFILNSPGNTVLSIIILLVNISISSAAVYNLAKASMEFKNIQNNIIQKMVLETGIEFQNKYWRLFGIYSLANVVLGLLALLITDF